MNMYMDRASGFTLLELVIVIVLVGVLAISASSRFATTSDYRLRITQENIISALSLAQQLAMAGHDSEFSITNGSPQTFRVRYGTPLNNYEVGSISYPVTVFGGITLSPSAIGIDFNNRLGQPNTISVTPSTPIVTISDTGRSVGVCLSSSGYAYAC